MKTRNPSPLYSFLPNDAEFILSALSRHLISVNGIVNEWLDSTGNLRNLRRTNISTCRESIENQVIYFGIEYVFYDSEIEIMQANCIYLHYSFSSGKDHVFMSVSVDSIYNEFRWLDTLFDRKEFELHLAGNEKIAEKLISFIHEFLERSNFSQNPS